MTKSRFLLGGIIAITLIFISIILILILFSYNNSRVSVHYHFYAALANNNPVGNQIVYPYSPLPNNNSIPTPIPTPVEEQLLARVQMTPIDSFLGFFEVIFFIENSDGVIVTDPQPTTINVYLDGVLKEVLTGTVGLDFAYFSSDLGPGDPTSLLNFLLSSFPVVDNGTPSILDLENYTGANQSSIPPQFRMEIFVGNSNNLDRIDEVCSALAFEIVSAVGSPFNNTGTVTYNMGKFTGIDYGPGPYPIFTEYDLEFQNGNTAVIVFEPTTSNQQFWMAQRLVDGFWDIVKANTSDATTTGEVNGNTKWDDFGEGGRITINFTQAVSNVGIFFEDLDQGGQITSITPEANAYINYEMNPGAFNTNANGIFQVSPSIDNGDCYLFWEGPLSTFSFIGQESGGIIIKGIKLFCEIPADAIFV